MVEDAKYSLRARWVQQGSLLCPWDCHGGGKCTDILGQPTCVCYDGTYHKLLLDFCSVSCLLSSMTSLSNEMSCSGVIRQDVKKGTGSGKLYTASTTAVGPTPCDCRELLQLEWSRLFCTYCVLCGELHQPELVPGQ